MTNELAGRRVTWLWIAVLLVATIAATYAFRCMTPFASLAALAAVHMRRRDGVLLVGAAWVLNQGTGFCLLGYPTDATTIAWGVGIGSAAVMAALAGSAAAATTSSYALRVVLAFVAAFVAFKLTLVAWSLVLGDTAVSTSLAIAGPQMLREAAVLAGLLALYRGLVAIGVPAAPAPRYAIA